jgi:hypothetical protein
MGPESDERIKRTLDAFLKGSDGKPDAKLRQAGFDEVARALVQEGRLIDLGFLNDIMRKLPPGLSETTIDMLRNSFFLGARVMMQAIEVPDDQEEATDADVARIEGMRAEIEVFVDQLNRRAQIGAAMQMKTAGNA